MCRISEILSFLDIEGIDYIFQGDKLTEITSFSSVKKCCDNSILFCSNYQLAKKYELEKFNDILLITTHGYKNRSINVIEVLDPRAVFFYIVDNLFNISLQSNLDQRLCPFDNTKISNNSLREKNISIGSNVTISNCVSIGKNVIIESGASIGVEPCSFYVIKGRKYKVPHFAGVTIGDDVFIGANSVIERGTFSDTYIGNRTKISACCCIEHNVVIKEDVSVTAGCVIAGSAFLDIGCRIHPNASVAQGVHLGKHCLVGIGSTVLSDVGDKEIVVGNPAKFIRLVTEDDIIRHSIL